MICDGVKPVAIAGVMGGVNSEVKEDTKTILLESAYFNPSSIRKTSKWLGMNTDAAFRFGRGVDPGGVVRASNRAAQLMAKFAGGTVCRGCIDEYPKTVPSAVNIPLRVKRTNDILGTQIEASEIVKILKRLEMEVHHGGDGCYHVTPPTYRVDIEREIDLIEEVARLYGYDRVPVTLPNASVMTSVNDGRKEFEERMRGILRGSGYSEIITYSFVAPESVDILGLKENDDRRKLVIIRNPLTEDQSVMRSTLVYGLLQAMKKNAHAGTNALRVFEMGRIFFHKKEGELPLERNRLGCLLAGLRYEDIRPGESIQTESAIHGDFYDLKGCVENILDDLRIRDVEFTSFHEEPFLHPGKSCAISSGSQILGFLGEMHPDVCAKMDVKTPAVVVEMDMDALAEHYSGEIVYRDLPKFPSVTRDVAFVVGREMEAKEMLHIARRANKELLEKVSIFDVYTGKSVPCGMKSLGLRFSYRASDRTLTDDEVNEIHREIVKNMVDVTGAKIRGEGE